MNKPRTKTGCISEAKPRLSKAQFEILLRIRFQQYKFEDEDGKFRFFNPAGIPVQNSAKTINSLLDRGFVAATYKIDFTGILEITEDGLEALDS